MSKLDDRLDDRIALFPPPRHLIIGLVVFINDQIYENWKKRYQKTKVWQNRKEIEYIFEFCYRRAMTAQTNKIANVNKITWEKRFNSLASIKECLETN